MTTSRVLILELISIAAALTVASGQDISAQPRKSEPEVRMVYLIPSDRTHRADYANAMEKAIEQLQIWYQGQLGNGTTFSLPKKTVVEVFTTNHTALWYSTNPLAGTEQSLWFWFNALADGFALTGGQFDDPQNRWVFYLDADPACQQVTGGVAGVALLPKNDLRGLVGEPNVPPCAGQQPDTAGICRWVGGLGHELGHAFGLPHPVPCPGASSDNALMCVGYIIYPGTYLLPDDKTTLNQSQFFGPVKGKLHQPKNFGCTLP